MTDRQVLSLGEIERQYPERWVLVEETDWDRQGNPTHGRLCVQSEKRADLEGELKALHARPGVKTFIFYTGDKIPEDTTVVL